MTKRIITGLALLAIGIFVITYGNGPLWVWVAILINLTTYELSSMLKNNSHAPLNWITYPLVNLGLLTSFLPQTEAVWRSPVIKILVLGLIAFYTVELFKKKIWTPPNRWLTSLKLSAFMLSTYPFIYLVREAHNGLLILWFCCIIIWSYDSLALFGGKLIGQHPLTSISPKKTIEGTAVGIIGCYIIAAIMATGLNLDIPYYLIIATVVIILAQIGDLHESLAKRSVNVKDSSQILPGHGGIYDRADSTLFVMPVVFYLFQ